MKIFEYKHTSHLHKRHVLRQTLLTWELVLQYRTNMRHLGSVSEQPNKTINYLIIISYIGLLSMAEVYTEQSTRNVYKRELR